MAGLVSKVCFRLAPNFHPRFFLFKFIAMSVIVCFLLIHSARFHSSQPTSMFWIFDPSRERRATESSKLLLACLLAPLNSDKRSFFSKFSLPPPSSCSPFFCFLETKKCFSSLLTGFSSSYFSLSSKERKIMNYLVVSISEAVHLRDCWLTS